MTKIFKFAPFYFTRSQRQSRMFSLQCLHSRQLIRTDRFFSLFSSTGSLLVHATDLFHRFCPLLVWGRGQSIANQGG